MSARTDDKRSLHHSLKMQNAQTTMLHYCIIYIVPVACSRVAALESWIWTQVGIESVACGLRLES